MVGCDGLTSDLSVHMACLPAAYVIVLRELQQPCEAPGDGFRGALGHLPPMFDRQLQNVFQTAGSFGRGFRVFSQGLVREACLNGDSRSSRIASSERGSMAVFRVAFPRAVLSGLKDYLFRWHHGPFAMELDRCDHVPQLAFRHRFLPRSHAPRLFNPLPGFRGAERDEPSLPFEPGQSANW